MSRCSRKKKECFFCNVYFVRRNFLTFVFYLKKFIVYRVSFQIIYTLDTKCALSYSNIFMGWFEEMFIFSLLTNLSDSYLRFVDETARKSACQTNRQQSDLHSKSEHPNPTKKGIAYRQALRVNKMCYNGNNLHNQLL